MDYQVVVVGGGPVGLGLAIDLGLRGVSCALVEQEESLHRIPKGQNLTQRTMEHLRLWDVDRQVRAARVMPRGYPIGGVTAFGSLMGPYSYRWYRRARVAPYYFAENERLPQYLTEGALRDRIAGLSDVDALFGWAAVGLDRDADAAEVAIVSPTGERRTVRTEYVVGCDGSHSFVRREAGIGEAVSDHQKRMVLIVFRSRPLHELLERFSATAFFKVLQPGLDGYWQFLGRVDVGSEWFFHAPVPAGTTADNFDFDALLHQAVGTEFPVDYEYLGFWDLRIAIADGYRKGRVFLAGDAAHSHPPYGGYGVNTGLEDARNLGWKLAGVLEGWGSDALLASYDEERRPVFASTARDFIEAFINEDREFVEGYDPGRDRTEFEEAWERRAGRASVGIADFEPHYEGSPIVFGPEHGATGATGAHQFTARPGHHLAPVTLSAGRDLFDELGAAFALIALGDDGGAVDDFTGAAESLGVPLRVVRDTLEAGREAYGSPLALVRPDHYVAWVGRPGLATGEAKAVLRRVTGG